MTKRIVKHEIKLETSVKIILAVLAIGVAANAFAPTFSIKEALALGYGDKIEVQLSGAIGCTFGCN